MIWRDLDLKDLHLGKTMVITSKYKELNLYFGSKNVKESQEFKCCSKYTEELKSDLFQPFWNPL